MPLRLLYCSGHYWGIIIALLPTVCIISFVRIIYFDCNSNNKGALTTVQQKVVDDNDNYYERYYQLPSLQYLWNHSFVPQEGYPIAMERWNAVSNNTCVTSAPASASFNSTNPLVVEWNNNNHNHNSNIIIPHAIVIGCQKCGSTAMANFFRSHPDMITPTRELHFLSWEMDTGLPLSTTTEEGIGGGIHQHYWQQRYFDFIREYTPPKQRLATMDDDTSSTTTDNDGTMKYVIEKTPNYLLLSDRVPQRLLCLSPSSKLIAMLRHPVDRAFSHYNMAYHSYYRRSKLHDDRPFPSFDEWIRQDYDVLVELGVLQNNSNNNNSKRKNDDGAAVGYQGTVRERQGWAAYTKLGAMGTIGGLGRGLYSLQILQWQEAYRTAQQPMDMIVLSSDSARENPQHVFDLICDHLGLSRHPLGDYTLRHGNNERDYSSIPPMSNATRQWLESIFEPYNRQLTQLLGKQFWN